MPFALPILWLVSDPDWQSILALGFLYIEFIILVRWWGRVLYHTPHILLRYGLSRSGQNLKDASLGLFLGTIILFCFYGLQGQLGWLIWQKPGDTFFTILLEGLAIALGIGFAEELLFRGWLLDELERDYGDRKANVLNSLLFAMLHFLKPLQEIIRTFPQFPGLVLFGLTLLLAKRVSQGRLGIAIGLHAGFVWAHYCIVVGQLTTSTQQVPPWVMGIDNNPLAGLSGLMVLTSFIFFLNQQYRTRNLVQ